MWVIKTRGKTFYVNHVTCELPWSTKETPDNPSTKGSIKVKNALLCINDLNEAQLTTLTAHDQVRLRNQRLGITRIIFEHGGNMHQALKANEFRHSPFKNITGGCGTSWAVCDLLDRSEATFAALKYQFRVLQPNEGYYRAYDQPGDIDADMDHDDLDDTP